MLPEETTKDVNYPQYHDTTEHCCTGCANTLVPLHRQVPLSYTRSKTGKSKSWKTQRKKVKKLHHLHMHMMQIWKAVGWAKPTPFQPVAPGHREYCWNPEVPVNSRDVPAGSDGSSKALWCLTQKQMFSGSGAVATPTAAKGQDSHRKGSKAKLRERFLQNCKHWAIPLHPVS